MDPATLIAFVSLVVALLAFVAALPATIDATWNLITKFRMLTTGAESHPPLLKKSEVSNSKRILGTFLKKEAYARPTLVVAKAHLGSCLLCSYVPLCPTQALLKNSI